MERLWAFALCVAYVPGVPPAAEVGRWAVVLLGGMLWVPRRNPGWLLLGGAAWALASLGWTLDWQIGLGEGIKLCCLVGLAAAAPSLEKVMEGFVAGLGVSSAIGLLQLLGWQPLLETTSPPQGLFVNSGVFAELAALGLLWGLAKRCWWQIGASIFPVMVSGSRIGLLVVAVGLLSLRKRWAFLGLVGLVGAVTLLAAGKIGSAGGRLAGWEVAWETWTWWGLGEGFWHGAFPDGQLIHSELGILLSELGLPGLLLVGWICWVGWWGWRWLDEAERTLCCGLAVECLFSYPLHLPTSAALAAVVAGRMGTCGDLGWALWSGGGMGGGGRSKELLDVGDDGTGERGLWPGMVGAEAPAGLAMDAEGAGGTRWDGSERSGEVGGRLSRRGSLFELVLQRFWRRLPSPQRCWDEEEEDAVEWERVRPKAQ